MRSHASRCGLACYTRAMESLALGFGLAAVAVAIFGVVMQNKALGYAELGEAPDFGGSAFFGGAPGDRFETAKAYHIDLRAHYRRAASSLSMQANLILLVSVVAGVLSGEASRAWVVVVLVALGAVIFGYTLCFFVSRRRQVRYREGDLEKRRIQYNDKFATERLATPIAPFTPVGW